MHSMEHVYVEFEMERKTKSENSQHDTKYQQSRRVPITCNATAQSNTNQARNWGNISTFTKQSRELKNRIIEYSYIDHVFSPNWKGTKDEKDEKIFFINVD